MGATPSFTNISTETLLKNVTQLSILDKDTSSLIDIILEFQSIPTLLNSSLSSSYPLPFPVDLIFADIRNGTIEKIPLTNSYSYSQLPKSSKTLCGFSIFDGAPFHVNISVLYEKRNAVIDASYEGYYFLPWSWTGFPQAFPKFTTKGVDVDKFTRQNGEILRCIESLHWFDSTLDTWIYQVA